jgi:hypothetical protein
LGGTELALFATHLRAGRIQEHDYYRSLEMQAGRFVLLELAAQSIPVELGGRPVAIEHEDEFVIATEADCVS